MGKNNHNFPAIEELKSEKKEKSEKISFTFSLSVN